MKKNVMIDMEHCVGCGCCVKVCLLRAVSVPLGIHAVIDTKKCVGCGRCVAECPASLISIVKKEAEIHE